MSEAPRINIPEWSVSELSAALKRTVEDEYGHVRVRGEISGFRGPHSSGHCYFALKDEGARIDAVVWKGVAGRMRFKPEEGLEVIATGRLTTYPGRSSYQIVIDSLEPAGVGALMALLEERKKKLAAEGLFDEARKQLLPWLPEVIGVVTSPTGAVIRDILHRLADRFPRHVIVWPVRVQGEGSAEEVAAAIRGFNDLPEGGKIPRPDLLIVARGGGSIEDLWSFNEEIVVRAAADSMIPLISAVGHETDVTLIDFVSDKRAPTPTAAAEIAVPVRSDLIARIDGLARRAFGSWTRAQENRRTELRAATRALLRPEQLFENRRQNLDLLGARLPRALRANAQVHRTGYSRAAARLTPGLLRTQVERRRERFDSTAGRLAAALRANAEAARNRITCGRDRVGALSTSSRRAIATLIERRRSQLDRAGQLLAALSYHGVLARGFALVRGPDGAPLRAAAAVSPGLRLDIEFSDGHVAATADAGDATPAPRPQSSPTSSPTPAKAKRRRDDGAPGQGNLFGT
jgi:exodeoxyribonuclease VII large subunit